MDFIKIDGLDREVILKHKDVNEFVKIYNKYYSLATKELRSKENKFLLDISKEKDRTKQLKMMNKLTEKIQKEIEQIPVPFFIIHDILWQILPEGEQKQFTKFGFKSKIKMIDSIRDTEYQALLDFIGKRILNLAGYNKKKL